MNNQKVVGAGRNGLQQTCSLSQLFVKGQEYAIGCFSK